MNAVDEYCRHHFVLIGDACCIFYGERGSADIASQIKRDSISKGVYRQQQACKHEGGGDIRIRQTVLSCQGPLSRRHLNAAGEANNTYRYLTGGRNKANKDKGQQAKMRGGV